MKLNEFSIGDKVHVPSATYTDPNSVYSVIHYIGERLVFLRAQDGFEFTLSASAPGFEIYIEPKTLEELGDDLVSAIERASENVLLHKTAHMILAIENWKERRAL